MELEKIWTEFDTIKNVENDFKVQTINMCYNCEGNNVKNYNGQNTCCDCGLVLSEEYEYCLGYDNNVNNVCNYKQDEVLYDNKKVHKKYGKIKQMQEWYKWTNEEKITYKLGLYTEQFCSKLGVSEKLIPMITDTVNVIMSTIKENYGTKRARVKDGIIIMCIYLVSKNTEMHLSYSEMAKKMGINIKYVTKADSLILELVNAKKLNFDSIRIQDIKTPYQYILETIKKNKLRITDEILNKVKMLIEICEDNDLLVDHSPQSIGACCFYYVLKKSNDEMNIRIFSSLSDLSMVTIMKTYNKLKTYEVDIQKYGI